MNKWVAVAVASLSVLVASPLAAGAADKCPDELAKAKAALASAQTSLKKSTQVAKSQEIQAPRAQAGARSEVQAPRAQDVQAPRAQDVQAPRAQDVQAPRAQDVQAPRAQDVQAPRAQDASRVKKAEGLVRQSEAACKKGDMTLSAQKAKEALTLLAP